MFRIATTSIAPRSTFVAARSLHATPVALRTVTEAVKDTAQNVNLKVGQTLAKGLEKSEDVTEKVQESVGSKGKEAKLKADEHAENARHKAIKAATGAQEAKEDLKRNMKE